VARWLGQVPFRLSVRSIRTHSTPATVAGFVKGTDMETELIEYMEARRKKRNQLVAAIAGVAIVIGIGVAAMQIETKEDVRNKRTDELVDAMLGRDD